jgi:hypothetical protein
MGAVYGGTSNHSVLTFFDLCRQYVTDLVSRPWLFFDNCLNYYRILKYDKTARVLLNLKTCNGGADLLYRSLPGALLQKSNSGTKRARMQNGSTKYK